MSRMRALRPADVKLIKHIRASYPTMSCSMRPWALANTRHGRLLARRRNLNTSTAPWPGPS
eukprot:2878795-Pyramimonas_sp.AAC.1